jgi:antitoxin component HigA of HigAB toxin-antitoxin module
MYVYDSTDICQANQCIKTTREIADYIGRTFKYGMEMHLSIENMEIYVISQPEDPPNNASCTKIRNWEKSVNEFLTRKTILQEYIKKTY